MTTLIAGAAVFYDIIHPVDALPAPGRVATIKAAPYADRLYGGTAFNIAVTMVRLGAQAGVIHAAGADFPGSPYEAYLRQAGVELGGIQIRPDTACGFAYLFYDAAGETLCFSYPGAGALPPDLPGTLALLESTSRLVIAPVFQPWMGMLIDTARSKGISMAAVGIPARSLSPYLPALDVLFANVHETAMLCEAVGVTHTRDLLTGGLTLIYETHGAGGSRVITPDGEHWIPPTQADAVVDPTGAGDSYAGAVLAGLDQGLSPVEAGLRGSVVASFVVEAFGCQAGLPGPEAVRARSVEQHGE
ncbi:MAG: hypothetical protein IT326_04315 [Anaerolineae bacterium]|nr:hypothetical protein [Anaerolineae bacterium]